MQVNLHTSTEGFCSTKETQTENHFGLSIIIMELTTYEYRSNRKQPSGTL